MHSSLSKQLDLIFQIFNDFNSSFVLLFYNSFKQSLIYGCIKIWRFLLILNMWQELELLSLFIVIRNIFHIK